MQLSISHRTVYTYDTPLSYGLQRVRLFPVSGSGQNVIAWDMKLEGARQEAEFKDHHGNRVVLTSLEPDRTSVAITCTGVIETTEISGVVGKHVDYAPLWYFERPTDLTYPGPRVEALVAALGTNFESDVQQCHALSALIAETVEYRAGETDPATTAENALGQGRGVCQDHAQIFVAAARALGFPARYVSGYLMMDDRVEQDATHAWAEAHLQGLGWVGFDVSNGMSPDERYVRVANGRDYRDAAPVAGMRFGEEAESMTVEIQVQQTLAGGQVQQ
jgi:transglutaminase-like putative cysteine protease